MDPIRIELNVDELVVGYDGRTLADVIVDRVADKVMARAVDVDLTTEIGRRVREIRDREIHQRVGAVLDEAIAAAVQETDGFGQPKGPPRTLREVIIDTMVAYLKKETGDYNNRETVVSKHIRENVSRAVANELKAALDEGRAEVKAAVRAKGAEILEQAIVELAKAGTR